MIEALTFDLAEAGRFIKDIYASEHFTRTFIQYSFLFSIICLLFKYIINPLLQIRFYRNQGFSAEFIPFKDAFKIKIKTALEKHNDALYDFKQVSQQKQKNRAIVFNSISESLVVLLDPALNKEFGLQHSCYGMKSTVGNFAKIFTEGLSTAKGKEWKKQRKIISMSVHFELIKENLSVIQQSTIELLKELSRKNLQGLPLNKEMETITGESLGKIFFGEGIQEYSIKGQRVTTHLFNTLERVEKVCQTRGYRFFGSGLIKMGIIKSHKAILSDLRMLENVCRRLLIERKNVSTEQKDIAWHLIRSYRYTDEKVLSDETIISNFADFVIAGTSPIAHLIGMALYELSKHPEALRKLQKEIKDIYDQRAPISSDSLNRMEWLNAILKETLRMYNPEMLAEFKRALTNHKVGDIKIKKGTLVSTCFATSCFDSEYFEDPFTFKPQRWIDGFVKNELYVFTPFGTGPRSCIGQQLTMVIAKIVLSEFVKRFDFKAREGYTLKLGTGKLYGPDDGLLIDLTYRGNI